MNQASGWCEKIPFFGCEERLYYWNRGSFTEKIIRLLHLETLTPPFLPFGPMDFPHLLRPAAGFDWPAQELWAIEIFSPPQNQQYTWKMLLCQGVCDVFSQFPERRLLIWHSNAIKSMKQRYKSFHTCHFFFAHFSMKFSRKLLLKKLESFFLRLIRTAKAFKRFQFFLLLIDWAS